MTIIDRYIAREFGKLFALILASLTAVYFIIETFDKIRFFMSNQASLVQVVSYFLYEVPMVVSQMTPAAVLLASLTAFGTLSRSNEIVAMKANGISLYRLSLPAIIIAAGICVAAFVVSEMIAPYTTEKAEYIRLVDVQKKQSLAAFKQNQIWYRGKNGIYNFKVFDPQKDVLQGITIYNLNHDFSLTMRIDAERGEWKDGRWVFSNLLITRFSGDAFPSLERVPTLQMEIPEKPADFKVAQVDTDQMGFFGLRKYVNKIQEEGYDATRYQTDMHGKLAFSLISMILVVIGISFSMTTERSGAMIRSVGAGIVIGFSYWLVHAFFLSLGRSGTIPPVLSAWVANMIFSIAATVMYLRVRT